MLERESGNWPVTLRNADFLPRRVEVLRSSMTAARSNITPRNACTDDAGRQLLSQSQDFGGRSSSTYYENSEEYEDGLDGAHGLTAPAQLPNEQSYSGCVSMSRVG